MISHINELHSKDSGVDTADIYVCYMITQVKSRLSADICTKQGHSYTGIVSSYLAQGIDS
jgi:hypothetical protein